MNDRDSRPIGADLARHVGVDDDPARIARAVVTTLREIDQALSPIIGKRGVAALYTRCVHLLAATHPWLAGLHEPAPTAMNLDALGEVLARQDSGVANEAGDALLQKFRDLLTSLLGPSLTNRLLADLPASSLTSTPPQDSHHDD